MRRRLQASAALLLLAAAVVLTAVVAVEGFPRGITVLACLVLALAAAWWGLVRRGAARMVAFSVAALLLAVAVIVTVFPLCAKHAPVSNIRMNKILFINAPSQSS